MFCLLRFVAVSRGFEPRPAVLGAFTSRLCRRANPVTPTNQTYYSSLFLVIMLLFIFICNKMLLSIPDGACRKANARRSIWFALWMPTSLIKPVTPRNSWTPSPEHFINILRFISFVVYCNFSIVIFTEFCATCIFSFKWYIYLSQIGKSKYGLILPRMIYCLK